jgi:hypothetical protein
MILLIPQQIYEGFILIILISNKELEAVEAEITCLRQHD